MNCKFTTKFMLILQLLCMSGTPGEGKYMVSFRSLDHKPLKNISEQTSSLHTVLTYQQKSRFERVPMSVKFLW